MFKNREIRVGIAKANENSYGPTNILFNISKEDLIEVSEGIAKAVVGGTVTIIAAKSLSHAVEEILIHHGTK